MFSKKYSQLLFVLIMGFLMSLLMTLIITFVNTGMDNEYIQRFLKAWTDNVIVTCFFPRRSIDRADFSVSSPEKPSR